ncbi:potassium channel beta subunit family protein [Pinibacter soli]|uniref:Aldo/keto reductase n=1 Tax=Pinibacter soli TaxID=3044211 RepID=A0ABT6RCR0_9BACT|nr:aldo/keto reductase [Pinibacter soli]MDI3320293.1 aldo/keto reductase [Pinibacter soli]
MEYRYLGKTGLQLSVLSFGSWVTFHKQIDDNHADELMSFAYDNGVNFFDNAEVYALGESEKMMGRILKRKSWDRTSVVLSSKVYFGSRGKENKPNQTGLSRKHIMEACRESLQRLQVDYLDLFFCHRPDPNTPIGEIVWTMHNLIQHGKILYWGTSMWSAEEIMSAHKFAKEHNLIGPVVEQPEYNVFERTKVEQEYAPLYNDPGLGTTVWSPLAAGLLTGKYLNGIPEGSRLAMPGFEWLKERWVQEEKVRKVGALNDLAKQLNVSLPTMALAWCIKNPNVTTAILGATKREQLEENFKALEVVKVLNDEEMGKIEEILK